MTPQLARMVQAEFEDMDRLLQAAVNVMSMKVVTAPSPSKAEVKRQKAGLMMDLADVRAELAVTRHSLDAEVTFQDFSANMSENFPHIYTWKFPRHILPHFAIFCHFLVPFYNGTFNVSISPQRRKSVTKEKRRRHDAKYKKAAAKKKKKVEIDTQLAGLRRDLLASRASFVKVMTRVEELEAEAEVLEAEKHELEADIAASKQKYLAKKHEADRLRSDLEATELKLSELEDEFREYEDSAAADGDFEFRRKAREHSDADYEEAMGESRKGGREHRFETREAVLINLALGLAPSQIVHVMRAFKFDFNGLVPKLRWVQNMRKELRVAVCILAAATAADPKVSSFSVSMMCHSEGEA